MVAVEAPLLTQTPWSKRLRESGKAYEAFLVFRDLGSGRTRAETARRLGKSEALICTWGKRWDWNERAEAWDAHLEAERDAAHRSVAVAPVYELAEMNRRHAGAATALLEKALAALELIEPEDLGPKDVLAYIVEAVKLERMARGESDTDSSRAIEQEVVVRLLADPQARGLAVELAAKATTARTGPILGELVVEDPGDPDPPAPATAPAGVSGANPATPDEEDPDALTPDDLAALAEVISTSGPDLDPTPHHPAPPLTAGYTNGQAHGQNGAHGSSPLPT